LQSAMELPILVTAGYAILNDATSEEDWKCHIQYLAEGIRLFLRQWSISSRSHSQWKGQETSVNHDTQSSTSPCLLYL
jgi:hypothetical protein